LEKRFGKRKEFEKVLEANKELGKHLPNQEVRESFQRLSRSKFGSNSFQKSAKEGFEKAVSGSFNLEKTAEGLKTLAKSANPVSGAAKVGFKIAKAAIKQITKSITISY
jgi:phosphopantetheinyl transferase (holo-ACP synthase)